MEAGINVEAGKIYEINKRGGGAKDAKSINVEVGIIVEAGFFL